MVSAGVSAILLTQTLDALATMIILPTIPFFAMSLGANAFTISLIGSAYNLAQMVCSPAFGTLSDKMGRKTVMVMGLTAQAVCNGVLPYVQTVPQLIMVRVAMGMAMSTGPVEMAYIMDSTSSENDLSRLLCLQRITTSCGALVGPLVAKSCEAYPFSFLCRGLVCVSAINLVIGISFWKDVPPKELTLRAASSTSVEDCTSQVKARASTGFVSMLRLTLTNHSTSSLLLASWVYSLGYGIGDGPEIVFFKEHFAFDKSKVCYFLVVTNLSSLVFSTLVPSMVDLFGAQAVCKMGCLGAAASVLTLISLSGSDVIPYVYGALVVGLFGSMIGLGYMHLVRQRCPRALMGTMLGLQSSLSGFAGTVAPPTGGALYDVNNFAPYLLAALFAASSAGLYGALPSGGSAAENEPVLFAETAAAGVQRRQMNPLASPLAAAAAAAAGRGREEQQQQQQHFRRVSTFGQPIFPDKSFASQVYMNSLRIEHDPELLILYSAYRSMIDKERGGLKTVATVPGDMVAARAQTVYNYGAILDEAELGRSDTHGDMSSLCCER